MLGKSIGMAEEVAHGSCSDVPPCAKVSLLRPEYKSQNGQQ
jgi:hypothetical protein